MSLKLKVPISVPSSLDYLRWRTSKYWESIVTIVIPESNGSQVWRLPLKIYVLDIVSGLSTLVDV